MAIIVFLTSQNEVRKAQKKIAEQNLKKSVKLATEAAESAASDGKTFCIIQLDVGLDAAAVREAVSNVMEKKVIRIFLHHHLYHNLFIDSKKVKLTFPFD